MPMIVYVSVSDTQVGIVADCFIRSAHKGMEGAQ